MSMKVYSPEPSNGLFSLKITHYVYKQHLASIFQLQVTFPPKGTLTILEDTSISTFFRHITVIEATKYTRQLLTHPLLWGTGFEERLYYCSYYLMGILELPEELGCNIRCDLEVTLQ